ncbi:MAG: alternative ribosome rescue aminoacyl-tRNA hydrolase ArfB [Thermodesulfobacteriota bacterium]|nr:alternative ribosome rescue aminoacyl-tRNA hydrolase ArfB [Thermodesulfobacteriota bacterium]
MESALKINEKVTIPFSELWFTASRSSGSGGQNVNKVSTRITLCFDVTNSPSLTTQQKQMIQSNLSTRINKEGVLSVVSKRYRSQLYNRDMAVERFVFLLQESLEEQLPRKERKIPYTAKKRRLDDKKHRSLIKQTRSKKILQDD